MKRQYNTVHSPYTIDAYSNNHASLSLLFSLPAAVYAVVTVITIQAYIAYYLAY